jgi:hypothetical protein
MFFDTRRKSIPIRRTINAVINHLTPCQVSNGRLERQVITITATATVVTYKLDDGPFQESLCSNFMSSGYHTVTVVDEGGCAVCR